MNYTQYPYLKDNSFLKEVDEMQNKEQVIRITVLDLQEKPIQSIEGRVTGGNLNINASSAIRRTGSLSLIADEDKNDLTNINSLFYLNKKVKLETGFKNTTNKYLEYETLWFPLGIYLMSNPNLSSGTSGTTISLNLKDKMCQLNGEMGGIIPTSIQFDKDTSGNKIPYYLIIQELVNHWGGEQISKIIIDIPERATSLIKDEDGIPIAQTFEIFSPVDKEFVSQAGDSVVTILDKIKNALGGYEYFYDLDGNFIFREIKNYINTSYSSYLDKQAKPLYDLNLDNFIIDQTKGKNIYNFTDSKLITSYSNAPQQDNIKNEFIIWGVRGKDNNISIRYRLAIDKKPFVVEGGNPHDKIVLYELNNIIWAATKYSGEKPIIGASYILYENKWIWDVDNQEYVEVVVIPKDDDWRAIDWRTELYYQAIEDAASGLRSHDYAEDLRTEWPKVYNLKENTFRGESASFDYFLDFIDTNSHISNMGTNVIGRKTKSESNEKIDCVFYYDTANLPIWYFNKEEHNYIKNQGYPSSQVGYWQKILVEGNELYFFYNGYILEEELNDIEFISQTEIFEYFKLKFSGSLNDAYTRARELLYTHTQWGNAISLAGIPIYYLEPNHRITVNDNVSGIHGDYLINSISLPLDISGTMTLSCSKVLEKL